MPAQSREMTWHESVLKKIEEGNGVYCLLYEFYDSVNNHHYRKWATISDEDPMKVYYIDDLPQRRICDCEGVRYNDLCKHMTRVPEL